MAASNGRSLFGPNSVKPGTTYRMYTQAQVNNMRKTDKLKIKNLENKKRNSKELNLEKNTLILITDQRNKNIELYYVIYIIFVALFVIIQSSILIFK